MFLFHVPFIDHIEDVELYKNGKIEFNITENNEYSKIKHGKNEEGLRK